MFLRGQLYRRQTVNNSPKLCPIKTAEYWSRNGQTAFSESGGTQRAVAFFNTEKHLLVIHCDLVLNKSLHISRMFLSQMQNKGFNSLKRNSKLRPAQCQEPNSLDFSYHSLKLFETKWLISTMVPRI